MANPTFLSHLVGYPRIGPNRELKRALENRWSRRTTADEFDSTVSDLRKSHLDEQRNLVGRATDDFFVYDETLETAIMLGLTPDWAQSDDPFDTLSALARGTPDHEAWEMTKWFDTNYHFVVPELNHRVPRFEPLPWRVPEDDTTWVVLGPYSLVKLAKVQGAVHMTAGKAAKALWQWLLEQGAGDRFEVQLDEPCLGLTGDFEPALFFSAYREVPAELNALVSVQFGRPAPETVGWLADHGLTTQVPVEHLGEYADVLSGRPRALVSVIDGRSVWPDDPAGVNERLQTSVLDGQTVYLTPSTSLMFLPYTVADEDLPEGFQFAREKAASLRAWAESFNQGDTPSYDDLSAPEFPDVGELHHREHRRIRRQAQSDLGLPRLPTTTTGSLPQTSSVRRLRGRYQRGELDQAGYEAAIDDLIKDAVDWQEGVGLDVLVHGEFERSDMVEYFAQLMDGFHTTKQGWVVSYGSRCTRPPILSAPPSISEPMTVRAWTVAQDLSSKPVKGMLTGPVTIVNWSYRPPKVPDDRLFWSVAIPIAEEVEHLTEAGARVIQIDEPAVRERWPLPTSDAESLRETYARGVRASLNKVFSAPKHVQMHTHMCYGDFGDIVPLWDTADVDVASIEYSRSKDDSYIHQFYELFPDGHLQIGPGVFDVHSPHSPGAGAMNDRLEYFLRFMDPNDVWVNPDCGLKTRSWDDIESQLSDMVKAAETVRAELQES